MLSNGYQSVQELRNDRSLWARHCFNQVAHNSPGQRAAEMCNDIHERLACSVPQLSPLDDLARKLALPKAELELLWLLACCEIDNALATLLRHNGGRPALPANVARQLLQASAGPRNGANERTLEAGPAAAVEKSAIHRLQADGLIEITADHRLRLASRVLQLVTAGTRNRYPRGTTQPGYAATSAEPPTAPVVDEDGAWLASLQSDPTAPSQPSHETLLCVGICRVR
jgi:hypothetical protein